MLNLALIMKMYLNNSKQEPYTYYHLKCAKDTFDTNEKITGDISFSPFNLIDLIWLIRGASLDSAAACFGYCDSSFRQSQMLWLGFYQLGVVSGAGSGGLGEQFL